MRVVITGGTGFIGKTLTELLLHSGAEVIILTRTPKKYQNRDHLTYVEWLTQKSTPEMEVDGADVFINLAGESINSGRWTEERKKKILDSRMSSTEEILRIIKKVNKKPATLINASAIGYYKASETATYTEESTETNNDFLAHVVQLWESKAAEAEALGVRTAFTRFGIILGENAGALPKIAMPYHFFVGGTVGDGKQWMSWIHFRDVARAIQFIAETPSIRGPVNLTAPLPVRMKEFGHILAKILRRPHWIPAPAFAIKAALGEMSTLVLDGQKVIPEVLQKNGFQFQYPSLDQALREIY